MSFVLPPQGRWTQKNTGDSMGSIWSSFNLDLTLKEGEVKVTRLVHKQSTSADLANLGLPVGFVRQDIGTGTQNAPIMTVAGARVFQNSNGVVSSAFAQDARTTNPTTCDSERSDIANFNGYAYVTTASNSVYKTNSTSAWTTFTAGGADPTQHILCQYADRLYMQRVYSQVISWNTADTVATSGQYTLTIPNDTQNIITFMKAASDRIWIGTINSLGGQGNIYSWDGNSGNPVRYKLSSSGAVSGVVKDDVLYTVDTNGKLLVFNGGTFVEIARFPNFNRAPFYNYLNVSNDRFIHPNGMAVVEDKIKILIKTSEIFANTPTEEMCPSGIWEYDKDIGLHHKYSISFLDENSASITDYGQSRLAKVGALTYVKNINSGNSSNGTLIAGVQYYTDATNTRFGIFYDDNNDNYLKTGYLVTTKIPSSAITDVWQRLVLKYNAFSSSSVKIVAKYRTVDGGTKDNPLPNEATITWTSTTTFTTAVISGYEHIVGDEVEIVQGAGAGMCSHISAISDNGSTYTVTVDEVHTGASSGTAIARFQKWKKLGSVSDTTSTFKIMGFPSAASSNYLQLKVWMLMYGSDELKEIDIASVVSQPL